MRVWKRRFTRRYGQPTRVESSLMKRLGEHLRTHALAIRYGPVLVGYWYLPFQAAGGGANPFMTIDWVTSLRCLQPQFKPDINSVYGNMYTVFTPSMFQPEPFADIAAFFDIAVKIALYGLVRKTGGFDTYIMQAYNNLPTLVAQFAGGNIPNTLDVCTIGYSSGGLPGPVYNGFVPLQCLVRRKVPKIVRMMGVMALPRSYIVREDIHDVKSIERRMLFKPYDAANQATAAAMPGVLPTAAPAVPPPVF